MASKLLRDQELLVSLLMALMFSDVFRANVEGRNENLFLKISFHAIEKKCTYKAVLIDIKK